MGLALLACQMFSADGAPPVTRDIAYGTNAAQRLDLYVPAAATNAPMMMYVHGGGWYRGDKRAVHLKAEHFTKAGWLFISINYRLVPPAKFPDNVQDVAAAIAWVRKHAPEHGGNPEALFLMGHSAGCHLATLVATDGRYLKQTGLPLTAIKGVIALDTQAYDIAKVMEARAPELYANAFGKDPATHKEASPLQYVAKGKGIPPFLVAYTNYEPRRQAAEGFVKALRAEDVTAELVDASDRNHEAINHGFGDPQDEKVTGRAMAFLKGLLPKKTSP
jgi:acetyl esterase/lipase